MIQFRFRILDSAGTQWVALAIEATAPFGKDFAPSDWLAKSIRNCGDANLRDWEKFAKP